MDRAVGRCSEEKIPPGRTLIEFGRAPCRSPFVHRHKMRCRVGVRLPIFYPAKHSSSPLAHCVLAATSNLPGAELFGKPSFYSDLLTAHSLFHQCARSPVVSRSVINSKFRSSPAPGCQRNQEQERGAIKSISFISSFLTRLPLLSCPVKATRHVFLTSHTPVPGMLRLQPLSYMHSARPN